MTIAIINVNDYPDAYGDSAHVIIDVREVDEFISGHLPGAINIPLSEFQARFSEIPTGKTVLLVCQSGGRSMMAAEYLEHTGQYTDLVNLDGGTIAWMYAGKPIE